MDGSKKIPRSRWVLFLLLALTGCLADLVTKSYFFSQPERPLGVITWVIPNYFGFQTSLNEGALWGLGQGQVLLFAGISLIALLGIPIWLFYFKAAKDRLVVVAMGMVFGGIVGNLYDRLGLHGLDWKHWRPDLEREGTIHAVRDWILLRWRDPAWTWPNFNIADSLLVTGACLLLIHGLFFAETEPPESKEELKSSSKKTR